MITHRHTVSTDPADYQPLQKSRPLTGRAFPAIILKAENLSFSSGLIERYEELRCQALGEEIPVVTPMGLALFLRRGMPAWILAWLKPAVSFTNIFEAEKRKDNPGGRP